MSPIALFIPMLALGFLLGVAFFGSLWWTVRRGLTAPHPVMWFGLGTLARMTLLLTAFYYVTREGWPSVVACLSGVLIARVAVERFTRNFG